MIQYKILPIFLFFINTIACTPLDDYVNLPDPNYSYTLIQTYNEPDYKLYILNMTSQQWLNESIVDRPIWWHYIALTVPNKILIKDAALLWLSEGSNKDRVPKPADQDVMVTSNFSISTQTIAALIQQIPNQPLVFKDDPLQKKRSEDALIAWGWKKFIEDNSKPEYLLRLPMTKAAVRAMDTVQDFVNKNFFFNIQKFMITGKSKRGWTTWTTAAVDPRVNSAVPIVMDMLNINTALHQNFKALGGWTFAFDDYFDVNITTYLDSRRMFEMQKIIDPFYYLDRYKQTNILVISTTGDEFFFPDNTHVYWDNLVAATDGKVLHRRIPNIGHSVISIGDTIISSLRGYFLSNYYQGYLMPKLSWTRPNNATHGIIKAIVYKIPNILRPYSVRCWYAKTDNLKRDFRQAILTASGVTYRPITWTQTADRIDIDESPDQIKYKIAMERPTSGWLGFFLEFTYQGWTGSINTITTETNIIPEFYPYEDCTRFSCFGKLV